MKLTENLKAAWKTIREQPKGEQFSYFWEYYKWPAIVAVVLVAALLSSIVGLINRKETVFTGYILNSNAIEKDDEFLQGFYDYAGIDANKQEAAFYTDMYFMPGYNQKNTEVFQRILGGIHTGDADFIAGPTEHFQRCAYHPGRMFADLREFLDEETFAKLSDRFYYVDGAILDQLNAPVGESVNTAGILYPNPLKPELMENPIPVGIAVGDRETFRASYYYSPDTDLYLGVITSTTRPELMLQFINYLFSQ